MADSYFDSSLTAAQIEAKLTGVFPNLIEQTDPTTSTVGAVGQLYINTTTPKLYICTAVSGSTYTWLNIVS